MFLYDKFFSDYDNAISQILLNAKDMEHEEKKENLTNGKNPAALYDIVKGIATGTLFASNIRTHTDR